MMQSRAGGACALAAWMVTCVFGGGCAVYNEQTHVTLRDPSRVTVAYAGSHGDETLLRPGTTEDVVRIPARDPPYDDTPREGSTVERHDTAALAVRCPRCTSPQYRSMMGPDGYVELRGSPGHTLDWRSSGLAMRFDYGEMLPCHRSHSQCERSNLSLLLETPTDNVVSIRHQRVVARAHGENTGAMVGLATGISSVLVGVLLPFLIAPTGTTNVELTATATAGFVGVGTLFIGMAIAHFRATDSDTPVALPPTVTGT